MYNDVRKQLYNLTPARILEMYNDAIETIWLLQMRLNELRNENESLWESYEEVSDKLYG